MALVHDVELFLLERRDLAAGDGGGIAEPAEPDLARDPAGRVAARLVLVEDDPAQRGREVDELVTRPGRLASLAIDGRVRAALRAGEQPAEQVEQLIAALEVQLGERDEQNRVAPRGPVDRSAVAPLKPLGVEAPRLRRELPPPAWRQRRQLDGAGPELDEPLVLGDLRQRTLHTDPGGRRAQPHQLRHLELRIDLEQPVELAPARRG